MIKDINGNLKGSNLFLFFAIIFSAIGLIFVGTFTYNVMGNVLKNTGHSREIIRNVENIRFFDEVLSNSALLAASTGNAQWEKRYLHYEPKLDSAFNELFRINPLFANNQILKRTDSANMLLKAMEKHVFELVHLNKRNEAYEIITGNEYASQKAKYSQGLSAFIEQQNLETDQLQTKLQNAAKHSKWFFGLTILLFVIIWLSIERYLRKSRVQMIQQNQKLELQIQARKDSESALHESQKQTEKFYEQLQESIKASSIGLWEWDVQTNETYQSPEFKKQIGYDDDEIENRQEFYISHLHPEDAQTVLEGLKQLKSGIIDQLDLEYRFIHKDNTSRWMLSHTSLQRDQNGQPLRLFGTHIDITERKNSEQLIKELNERFKLIARATNDCVYDWDLSTNQVWWNPALSRLFNYPPEIITTDAQWWEERIHPDDHDSLMQDAQNVFDAKVENFSCEYRFQRADGSYAYVFDRATVLYDKDKNPIRWIGSVMDITERKKSEEKLKESEENYRILAEASPEMIYLVNTKGYLTYVNKIAAEQFRAPAQKLIGKHLTDIFPPDLAQQNLANIKNVIATKSNFQNEVKMVFPTGNRWIDARLTPVFDEKGQVIGVLGLSYDITERKQAEMDLRKSEERLKEISKPDFVWEVDEKGVYTYTSQAGIDLFGDIIGKTPFDFMTQDESKRLSLIFSEIVANKSPIKDLENWTIKKNGERCCLLTNGLPLFNEDGTFKGYRGVDRDITDRKLAEAKIKATNDELVKLNAEKDKFFSIIAHDLRSPFSSFLGLTKIMAEELPNLTMTEIQNIVVRMEDSASSLFSLLENLLHWARIQQGLIPFDPKLIQLHKVSNESIAWMKESAKNKGIELVYDIPEDLMVFADSNMLQTVIQNLISNAVKFTPKGGKISLWAKVDRDKNVEIFIKDSGIGMSSEMIDNLFRLDVQTNRKGTEGEVSSGLGLMLCKEFVEKHNGKIWVESEEGKGSTFYHTLPYNAEQVNEIIKS